MKKFALILLGFAMTLIPSGSNAQINSRDCQPIGLGRDMVYLSSIPMLDQNTSTTFTADGYTNKKGKFSYLIANSRTASIVSRVDLTYNNNKTLSINVCGRTLQSNEYPLMYFNLVNYKNIGITGLGVQRYNISVPRPAHTTTIQTVVNAD
jgi:hypothetical protein